MQDHSGHSQRQNDLFKPLSLEERLQQPAKKGLQPAASLMPYQKGQPYGSVPASAKPAVASSPSPKLPLYLSKRPSLSPSPGAVQPSAPQGGAPRITSTFPASSIPPLQGSPVTDQPFQTVSGPWSEAPVQEPLYSASPKRHQASRQQDDSLSPRESFFDNGSVSFPSAQLGSDNPAVAPDDPLYFYDEMPKAASAFPSFEDVYDEVPSFDPSMPIQDEVDAFFRDAPPRQPALDFVHPEQDPPLSADNEPYLPDDRYENASLPESAELPEDRFPYDEPYQPPCDPFYEVPAYPPGYQGMAYQPFDPNVPDRQDAAPEAYTPDGPYPAYVPPVGSSAREKKPVPSNIKKEQKPPAGSRTQRPAQGQPPRSAPPQKPPIRPTRVLALIVAAGLLLFCGIAGGQMVYRLATNEKELAETKKAYQELQGGDMMADAAKVELLPPGVTFSPTDTPPIVITPTPSPVITFHDAAADSLNHRDNSAVQEVPETTPTPVSRTRLTAYPDNSLRNIVDSMVELHTDYPDTVGRLVIPGVLDQVVVQRNNTYYLTHNYRGTVAKGGAVFMDESCALRNPPENLLLRGQGNVEGKTFAPLWLYKTGGQEFVSGATNATLTTLYEEAEYTLLAVIVAASDPADPGYFNFASHPTFSTDEAMLQYVESARSRSLYRFTASVEASDRLLTLATVSDGTVGECIVLLFRMLRPEELNR